MIINMAGGSANVQYMNFSLQYIVTGANYLTIPDVHIPGGVLKGFVLLKDDLAYNEMQNNKLNCVYANQDQLMANQVIMHIYKSDHGALLRITYDNVPVVYDKENQALSIQFYLGDYFFDAGRYSLFYW